MNAEDCRPRIVRGQGSYLYDDTGRRYLDGISGSYNHCLGHSHPALIDAVKQQIDTLVHACNIGSSTLLPEALAERLGDALAPSGLAHTFLVSGGSEGVETALKMAWHYQISRNQPQRTRVVAIDGAYHGCTLGAMVATRRAFINEGALPFVSTCSMTMPLPQSLDDLQAWEALLTEHGSTVAALIIEPVMAMAGTRQFPDGFLRALSSLARAHDIPLICDEVYCGIGRTGVLCESASQGASPDIVIFSKNLGGGFPITAVMTTPHIADSFASQPFPLFRHGHTQSGNLLGCRAALFILDHLHTQDYYENVRMKGERLLQKIRENLPVTSNVVSAQGKGLMLSITLNSPEACGDVQYEARRHGLIIGAADRHLKLAPPFTIDDTEIDELTQHLIYAISNAPRH
ncbi:aspartate aminotransferase family protein [Xanthomonas albilineans]|nr:aspartate aminotransferase family protein [Xanthomonas albilineans]